MTDIVSKIPGVDKIRKLPGVDKLPGFKEQTPVSAPPEASMSLAEQSEQKFAANQAAANAAAQEKLIAMRLRKQNRSGTLLTQPGYASGAETLG